MLTERLKLLVASWRSSANEEAAKRTIDAVGVAAGIRGCIVDLERVMAASAAPAENSISIQEAWEAAGGNPGIEATRDDLLIALRDLDAAVDEIPPKSAAPAEGREIVAWRHKWTNSEESGWGYYSAGPQADKLRLGLPGILGRDSGRENWEPLCLATAPTMIEEDAAIELLRKFMEYRDSDYVPNVLFDQARLIIDRAAAKGESDE